MIKSETVSERAERIELARAAEDYRRKGYTVTHEPKLDFFPGLRPDLVASKDGDNRVVEVKSRSSLLGNDEIVELAETVYSQPGWSFDLRLIGEPESLDTPKSAQSFSVQDILNQLESAASVRHFGLSETAFLLAWSACEAATRELMSINGVRNELITTSTHLLDQAAYHGIISRDDYFQLLDMAAFRNAFVHGFNVAEFDPELVSNLIIAVRNITEAIARGPIDDDDDDQEDFWPSITRTRNGDKPSTKLS